MLRVMADMIIGRLKRLKKKHDNPQPVLNGIFERGGFDF